MFMMKQSLVVYFVVLQVLGALFPPGAHLYQSYIQGSLGILLEKQLEFPDVPILEGGGRAYGFEELIRMFPLRTAFAFEHASKMVTDVTMWEKISSIMYSLASSCRDEGRCTDAMDEAMGSFIAIAEEANHKSAIALYRRKASEYMGVVDVIEGFDESHPGFEHMLAWSPKEVQEAFLVAAGSCDSAKAWSRIVDIVSHLPIKLTRSDPRSTLEHDAMYSKATADFYRVDLLTRALQIYNEHVKVWPRVPVIPDNGFGLPGFEKLITDLPSDILLAFTLKAGSCWDEHCWTHITKILHLLLQSSYKRTLEGNRRELKPISDRREVLDAALAALTTS
jgi:hypothetical protein